MDEVLNSREEMQLARLIGEERSRRLLRLFWNSESQILLSNKEVGIGLSRGVKDPKSIRKTDLSCNSIPRPGIESLYFPV